MFAVFVSGSGLDGFYSILARVGFTVLPGWGRLLLSFCRVRGSGVRRRSSGCLLYTSIASQSGNRLDVCLNTGSSAAIGTGNA